MSTIQCPRLNLNGTSADELLSQIDSAIFALNKAATAMREAAPHGRDYQTIAPGAYSDARQEHEERLSRIATLIGEYKAIYKNIADQHEERWAQRLKDKEYTK
jgi:hypothetical protein